MERGDGSRSASCCSRAWALSPRNSSPTSAASQQETLFKLGFVFEVLGPLPAVGTAWDGGVTMPVTRLVHSRDSWPSCRRGSRQSPSRPLPRPGLLRAFPEPVGKSRLGIANRNLHHIISSGYSRETARKNLHWCFHGFGLVGEDGGGENSQREQEPSCSGPGSGRGFTRGRGGEGGRGLLGTPCYPVPVLPPPAPATGFGVSCLPLDTAISFCPWETEGPEGEAPGSGDP